MTTFGIGASIAGVLATGAVGLAATATAVPTGGGSAAETITTLQDMGYTVQLNGTANGPLSQCTVTGVHGASNTNPAEFTTAYVDISCPGSD